MAESLAVLLILLLGLVVARFTGLKFVVALPVSLMAMVVTLFLAYIGGVLEGAFWVLVALVVASTGLAVVKDRSAATLTRTVLSPQALVFVLSAIGVWLLTRGRLVGLWDELRLWAGYPKILFSDPSLQLVPNAQLFEPMRNYTPGMPLAAYITNAFSPDFSESRVFLAYGLVAAAMLLPISARISWRSWFLIPVAALAIVALPLLMWNSNNDSGSFYVSLYVDPIVGIALGFLCWLIALGVVRRPWGSLGLGVTAAALYLFKDGMLGLSVFLILVGTLQVMREHAAAIRARLLRVLALAVPLAIVAIAWKLLLRINDVPNYMAFDYMSTHHRASVVDKFGNALAHEPLIWTTIVSLGGKRWTLFGGVVAVIAIALMVLLTGPRSIRAISWSRLLTVKVVGMGLAGVIGVVALAMRFAVASGDGISYVMVSVLIATALAALFFRNREAADRAQTASYRAGVVTLVGINVLYLVGIYFLVSGPFQGGLASFARYVSVAPTAGVAFLALYVAATNWRALRERPPLLASWVAALALASLVVLIPLRAPLPFDGGWNDEALANSEAILAGADDGVGTPSDPARVFYVNVGDIYVEAGLHHRTYFNLIGTGVSVANFYTDTNITATDSKPSAVREARDRFLSTIAEGEFDYVFFSSASPDLQEQFGALFPSGIHAGDVYLVDRTGAVPGFSLAPSVPDPAELSDASADGLAPEFR